MGVNRGSVRPLMMKELPNCLHVPKPSFLFSCLSLVPPMILVNLPGVCVALRCESFNPLRLLVLSLLWFGSFGNNGGEGRKETGERMPMPLGGSMPCHSLKLLWQQVPWSQQLFGK
jgi:hypothetical protein